MPRLNPAQQLVRSIHQSVATIDRALTRLAASLNGSPVSAAKRSADGTIKRRLTLSPKRRAQLKLHGRYLGHMRQLKPRQKAKVKAVKASKGYQAAIRMAKRLAQG